MTSLSLRRPIVRLALNQTEVALAIGVSATSVSAMVAEGTLPPPRRWRSKKLWLVSEIEVALSEMPVEGEGKDDVDIELEALSARWAAEPFRPSAPAKSRDTAIRDSAPRARYDPSMSNAELAKMAEEAAAQWREQVLAGHMNKREEDALRRLANRPAGKLISNAMVRIGPDTAERLELRGYIEIRWHEGEVKRVKGYVLLPPGEDAAMTKTSW